MKSNEEKDAENVKRPGDQFAYPPEEDIYANAQEEEGPDVDDLSKKKAPNLSPDEMNEKSFKDDVSGRDLDMPGAELDDAIEDNGSEDEENNS